MSSAICQNFVQNAWKKELCSNCFKSKDEHAARTKPKPVSLIPNGKVAGIIRTSKSARPKRSVCFPKDLTEIIGFGGEDWASDEEEDAEDDQGSESSEDLTIDSEEDESQKELKKQTRENTDFNTSNLKATPPPKKTTSTQLMLGKPLVDATGRKQTLLVTVTPFGEDVPKKIKTNSHIPLSKPNKETESKPSVVLTSYTKNSEASNEEKSLLEEITETLENGENPIQIRKKTQKEIVLSVANKENLIIREPETNKVEKKVALSRTPALKRDFEKPLVYQTSTAKIELLTNTKLKNDINHNEVVLEKPEVGKVVPPQSREQAGEPDGRADPETISEPPALPLTPPPPLETQSSFLHTAPSPIYEKPRVPTKPATVIIRKPPMNTIEATNQVLTTFIHEQAPKVTLVKQDSNGSDFACRINKRRAPRPPEEYNRNSVALGVGAEVVKEKRERSSSCSPKVRGVVSVSAKVEAPAPAPRKSMSVSTDSLAVGEEKRKKGRFSLKKFLRMGSNKELNKVGLEVVDGEGPPAVRPRLVIVHPSELNGAKVEVVPKNGPMEQSDYQNVSVASVFLANTQSEYATIPEHELPKSQQKPPPPPRHLDGETTQKPPIMPHPPKSVELLNRQKQYGALPNNKQTETVYANIGEVRSAMVPNKPQRTASMREREALLQERKNSHNYEPIRGENLYDYIHSGRSSSPDSDTNKHSPTAKNARLNKRSESSIDVSGDYFKYGNIPRSLSLTYCGSETESEIYSPYSFYGSESEVTEDDHDWIQNGRTHKLRSRKGRSIVHKNLEDNYGAVIVANHEALAQVLENIQQTTHIQPALRGLKSLPNLRWTDFMLNSPMVPLVVGSRIFHQAQWNGQNITLVINTGAIPSSTLLLGTCNLTPITEFSDLIPSEFLNMPNSEEKYIQATVAVLPWLQMSTIQSYSDALKTTTSQTNEETWKDATFVMLQLVNALKILQAQGIEELSLSLTSFVLCKEMDKDSHQRLCVLQGLGEEPHLRDSSEKYGTLCMCASRALALLQPSAKTTPLVQSLLNNERAVTLTQVKSILEFCLWGPSDVALGSTVRERELALQRWLDLQRATVLHGLVCARVQLTVYEEGHLFFLVRSSSRMMCDASLLLESRNLKHALLGQENK